MAKFIAYLPVGYPDFSSSLSAFKVLVDAGADVIEIGVPYSDPVMDGETIQRATKVAIDNGFHIGDVFRMCEEISVYANRQYRLGEIAQLPEIYIMSYFNMVMHYGFERFAGEIKDAGACGTIIPDLIPDEAHQWVTISKRNGLKTVFLTAPNSSDERLDIVTNASSGFVYASSLLGVTGARESNAQFADAKEIVTNVRNSLARNAKDTPVYLGLGVSTPAQATEIAKFADGVIVGSRLVSALEVSVDELFGATKALANAVHGIL